MRRWRRGGRGSPQDGARDPDLPALELEAGRRFRAAAMAAFRSHGVETTYAAGELHAVGDARFPLHNVSVQAAGTPERDWPRMLARHAAILIAAQRAGPPPAEDLQQRLYLSLWQRATVPWHPDHAIEVADDLVALPALDLPDTVQTAGAADQVAQWGGWDQVRRFGLANLARDRPEQVLTLGGQRSSGEAVQVLAGGYFTASRLLVLERVLAQDLGVERPGHGAVVAVPNRDLLAVHVLRSLDVVGAVPGMLALAAGEFARPGGISRHLYFWRHGQVQRITRIGTDDEAVVEVTGEFARALAELSD